MSPYFLWKLKKKKKLECHLLQILLGALRQIVCIQYYNAISNSQWLTLEEVPKITKYFEVCVGVGVKSCQVRITSVRLWLFITPVTILVLSMLSKNFSRQQFEIFFLLFPENRQFAWNVLSCFLGKILSIEYYYYHQDCEVWWSESTQFR